jgi:hypothetical protein
MVKKFDLVEQMIQDIEKSFKTDDVEQLSEDVIGSTDEVILEQTDRMLEDTLRSNLRSVVYENSELEDSAKIERLQVIDEMVITREQLEQYMENSVDPIIQASGIFDFDIANKDPKFVPISVYETALALQLAKDGEFETIRDLTEMSQSIKEVDKDLLEESVKAKKLERTELSNAQILENYLNVISGDWNLSDREKQLTFENAKSIVESGSINSVLPDVMELSFILGEAKRMSHGSQERDDAGVNAASTSKQPSKDPSYGQERNDAGVTKDVTYSNPQNKTMPTQQPKEPGMASKIWKSVKGGYNKLAQKAVAVRSSMAGFFKNHGYEKIANTITGVKGWHLALGATALAVIGAIIWKKTRNPDKVIAAYRAQEKNCALTSDPAGCKSRIAAQISKWEAKRKTA